MTNAPMRNEGGIDQEPLSSQKKEAMRKISDVSNSINNICLKLYDLVKMKLGENSTPNTISQESDIAIEREFGRALENFETECDSLSNDIEMEKKEFINYFLKYGAENSITDKLVKDYKEKREENFKNIINDLDDT
eukprot:CAMPEP_0197004262 /NCGR_PEP_ID=MMETSP1380-20130617/21184_1 /TAXON_ID=5936 /ORGANISM="Euplotes crassus, Strain CT5" /LENGTH=135 /DNA_ID=CAMNT_0042422999 /DNA_START=35 /DNA_END=438 /DNA_ORIENTATION=+